VKARLLTWAERSCTRCQCTVIPAVLFIGLVLVLFAAAHRAAVRESLLGAALAVAVFAVLAGVLAVLVRMTRVSRPAPPPRVRRPAVIRPPAARPAAEPPAVPRPDGMCAEECGRPAETEVAGCPVCRTCAAWLDVHLPADPDAAGVAVLPPASLLDGPGGQPAGHPEQIPGGPLPAELAEFERDLKS
jgi:hypothetical protein